MKRVLLPVAALLLMFGGCEGLGFRQGIEDLTLGLGNWVYEDVVDAGVNAVNAGNFGASMSISGEWAIIGACNESNARGAIYFYRYEDNEWKYKQRFTLAGAVDEDNFGWAVDIDTADNETGHAIVGAFGRSSYTGEAYTYSMSSGVWSYNSQLTYADATHGSGDYAGYSVSMEGGYAAVGAPGDDSWTGRIYIYKLNGTNWDNQASLSTDDSGGALGMSVAVNEDFAIAGAPDVSSISGAAYIYRRSVGIWGSDNKENWKVTSDSPSSGDSFGSSAAISGTRAIVGSYGNAGKAFVFGYSATGDTWLRSELLVETGYRESGDHFGNSVAIDGDFAVVGAPKDDHEGTDAGAVFFFEYEDGIWSHRPPLPTDSGPTLNDGDQLGWAVCVNDDAALVSTLYGDEGETNSGNFCLYRREILD